MLEGLMVTSPDGQHEYTITIDEAAEAWVVLDKASGKQVETLPEVVWQAKVCLETGNLADAKATLVAAGYKVSQLDHQ